MIIDTQSIFSDGQAITADAASTNVIDLKATGTPAGGASPLARDIGKGGGIPLALSVTEAFNNLSSLQVIVQVDDNAAFSSPKNVAMSRAYTLSELTLGARLSFPAELPEGTDEQFVRLFYDVTGTAPTAGKIFAGVVGGRQTNFG